MIKKDTKKTPCRVWLKIIAITFFQVTAMLLLVIVAVAFFEYKQQDKTDFKEVELFKESNSKDGLVKVLAESDVNSNSEEAEFRGERYSARDIMVGGEALMELSDDNPQKEIKVSRMKGKVYKLKEEDQIDYYASWVTNKPTLSTLKYKKEEEEDFKTKKEEKFGYVHTFTIADLNPSSVYEYQVESLDRWDNKTETEKILFFTGEMEASFFDVLEESFDEVFGWTRK